MTLYCGIDLHGNNSVVAVLDEGDQPSMRSAYPMICQRLLVYCDPTKRSWRVAWWSPPTTGTGWWMA